MPIVSGVNYFFRRIDSSYLLPDEAVASSNLLPIGLADGGGTWGGESAWQHARNWSKRLGSDTARHQSRVSQRSWMSLRHSPDTTVTTLSAFSLGCQANTVSA